LQIVAGEENSAIFRANILRDIEGKLRTAFGAFKVSDLGHVQSLTGGHE
jgi:hypothetical protein